MRVLTNATSRTRKEFCKGAQENVQIGQFFFLDPKIDIWMCHFQEMRFNIGTP